ncbi:MAG TPA: hypothetical protein VNC16_05830 [Solirubrobacterales bacterium]|jgi:hypothetical protein|nr:hypothetical protein [Solirubrobacterales bacterium]
MSKRIGLQATAVLAFALCVLLQPAASASAAPSPWWQIVTGSRPSNLWKPTDNVQEITVKPGPSPFGEGAAAQVKVGEETVGCLGLASFPSEFFCNAFYGFPVSETAAQFEEILEGPLGPEVEVTGGPVAVEPFKVTVPGRSAPSVSFFQSEVLSTFGSFKVKILSPGGSGRLSVKATNVGNAPLDATKLPLTIRDELPGGVKALGVEATAGFHNEAGHLDCEIEADDLVICEFEGTLPPFESLEVEVLVNLTDPVGGSAGTVSVSGGNGPTDEEDQNINVSPDKTPFGVEYFSSEIEEEGGKPAMQAGSHPFQLTTSVQFKAGNFVPGPSGEESSIEQPAQPRNLRFPLPIGFVGNAAAVPTCSMADFYEKGTPVEAANLCPAATVVGATSTLLTLKGVIGFASPAVPVFNLPAADGEPARLGFIISGAAVLINTEVDPDNKYRIIATINNTTQFAQIYSSTLSIWGTPGDASHDSTRNWECIYNFADVGPCKRPPNLDQTAFLRQPVSCVTPVEFGIEAEPWNTPFESVVDRKTVSQPSMSGCNQVPFDPAITAGATSKLAGNPSGFDFQLDMKNVGLLDKGAIAEGQAKKIEVTLPEGMTVNPSQGEGLVGCSPADLAREKFDSRPGEGCPEASKVGEVKFSTPLLKEEGRGSVYVATPFDNPFGSLIAIYIVAKIPERGVLIKQAGVVKPNPDTGQLTTIVDDVPQLPFTSIKLSLRAGARSSLVTPPTCGSFDVVARFTPWSAKDPNNPTPAEIVTRSSAFEIERGVDGGACPSGGTPPFNPGLSAGTINNAAKSYSPFNLRLTRKDGEQEFTNFSIKLPPGVIGKLAGVGVCSDAAIAAAKARTGPNGAQEELDRPSCPASSQVGRTLAGSGVGASLTYVPGKAYLAGPYNGAKMSVVAITAAKVGPFDLGTVVIREALKVNPDTAEVFVDPTASDPLPHIIQGIEVHLRDIRVYLDRPEFMFNPTNCDRTSTASTVLGSGLDFASAADNVPVTVTSPFQAADCASLGFKPKLSLQLLGGTKRGDTPRLKAVLKTRKGDANIGKAQVTLPHSAFLEQAHIRTVCTRVQFNAGGGNGEKCPKGSIYGKAKAITPVLDEPFKGKVYLRSSNHELPDLVAALHSSKADFNLVGRIDSLNGRIRNTFESPPDVPVTKFILEMQGGQKGLIVNSQDICKGKHRALAHFDGQNGRFHDFKPVVKAKCGGKKG